MSKKNNTNRYRLSDQERDIIERFRGNSLSTEQKRFRLKPEEEQAIKEYRRVRDESDGMGIDYKNVRGGWLKSKEVSLNFVNPDFKGGGVAYEDVRDRFIADAKAHAPEYKTLIRSKSKNEYLLCMNLSDLHIGKLTVESGTGEEYNTKIAIKRAKEAITSLLDTASGYNITQIVLPTANDALHTDGSKASTTKGTPQDVSGAWHENFIAAREMYVEIIEMLIPVADVHIIHVPSNHDYASGFFLSDAVACWFSKCGNVTKDVDMKYRKYYQYGKNLIGYSHGDGAKMEHMPLLMANEAKEMWADTEFRYIYLSHIHHKNAYKFQSAKDYHGVTVEYMRSPSAADSYHHINGYQHVKRAIEAFIHHKENGQVARLTYHTR